MDGRQRKREAKFRAGLILESVMCAGWERDPQVIERYGEEEAIRISTEILKLADSLISRSGRPG